CCASWITRTWPGPGSSWMKYCRVYAASRALPPALAPSIVEGGIEQRDYLEAQLAEVHEPAQLFAVQANIADHISQDKRTAQLLGALHVNAGRRQQQQAIAPLGRERLQHGPGALQRRRQFGRRARQCAGRMRALINKANHAFVPGWV